MLRFSYLLSKHDTACDDVAVAYELTRIWCPRIYGILSSCTSLDYVSFLRRYRDIEPESDDEDIFGQLLNYTYDQLAFTLSRHSFRVPATSCSGKHVVVLHANERASFAVGCSCGWYNWRFFANYFTCLAQNSYRSEAFATSQWVYRIPDDGRMLNGLVRSDAAFTRNGQMTFSPLFPNTPSNQTSRAWVIPMQKADPEDPEVKASGSYTAVRATAVKTLCRFARRRQIRRYYAFLALFRALLPTDLARLVVASLTACTG